jgi:CheY-like chemotaxis protein
MPKVNVLIVQDELIIARDIRKSLENDGLGVTGQTDSAKAAVKLVRDLHPDLVLMDIGLKGEMDGIEAARQIQTRFDLPVIFLTASADQSTLDRLRQVEPYGYFLKPYRERELVIAIEMAVTKHAMEMNLRDSQERYELAVRGADRAPQSRVVHGPAEPESRAYKTSSRKLICSSILGY